MSRNVYAGGHQRSFEEPNIMLSGTERSEYLKEYSKRRSSDLWSSKLEKNKIFRYLMLKNFGDNKAEDNYGNNIYEHNKSTEGQYGHGSKKEDGTF